MEQLELFEIYSKPENKIINVASVPQRSPFRYPGGKTWLIPEVRKWLNNIGSSAFTLVEPFAGGGTVALTAAFENLVKKVIMMELDEEIAATWKTILSSDNEWLAEKICSFEFTLENIKKELDKPDKSERDTGFCTILKNRICHGGIIAKGSGFIKNGENGKGILSRWYPETLARRIRAINSVKDMIDFYDGNALELMKHYIYNDNHCFFIDPPYTVAGRRLYNHHQIDHMRLFEMVSEIRGDFLMTYDDTEEMREMAKRFGLPYKSIPMKTTHHREKFELLIFNNVIT